MCYYLPVVLVCAAVDEVMTAWGWREDGDTVYIQNQEELIKPKKILAKIELESESRIHRDCVILLLTNGGKLVLRAP